MITPQQQAQLLNEFLGLNPEELESIDEAKSKFNESFIARKDAAKDSEIVSKVVGKITGGIETSLKASFADFDFNSDELKGKRVEDKIKAAGAFISGKMSELSEAAKGASSADVQKVKDDYEMKISDLNKKFSDLNGLHESLKKEHETTVKSYAEKAENEAIQSEYNEAFKAVQFSPDFLGDALKVKGFNSEFSSRFKLTREDGKVVVKDSDGKSIQSKEKAGEFMSVAEALKSFAVESNVIKRNPIAGKPIQQQQQQQQQQPNQSDQMQRNRNNILRGMNFS